MKFTAIALAACIAVSGTSAYAQSHTPGSSVARQDIGDPLIRKPTSEDRAAGASKTTTGRAMHKSPQPRQGIGGPPSSQQSGTDSGG